MVLLSLYVYVNPECWLTAVAKIFSKTFWAFHKL